MMKNKMLVVVLGCVFALAFALAGCSSGGSSASSAEAEGSASASAEAASAEAAATDELSAEEFVKEQQDIDPIVIVDDDNVTIKAVAKQLDIDDDPGFVLSIDNKTDKKIWVNAGESAWTVNGQEVNPPSLLIGVEPNDTVPDAFLWFDHVNLGTSSLDDLTGIFGDLVVEEYDTGEQIGEYEIEM